MHANLSQLIRTLLVAAALGLCLGGPVGCQPAGKTGAVARTNDDLARLRTYMTGAFSSEEQAKADPEYLHIALHMVPIWGERNDGPWLYVEQAMASAADKPYRQRVYRLSRQADGALRSDVFTLPGDPLAYAGQWKSARPLADVDPSKLTPRDGCSLVLKAQPDGTFKGATQGQACASDLRGATYATSEALIGPSGMVTWDRGYNDKGEQVWGAVKGGYDFRKAAGR